MNIDPKCTVTPLSAAEDRAKRQNSFADITSPDFVTPATRNVSMDQSTLEIPSAAMYGRMGEMPGLMEAPAGWAYVSCLSLIAGMGVEVREPQTVRPTLFTALLGGPGVGKSTVMSRARQCLRLDRAHFRTGTPASDRGLVNLLGNSGDTCHSVVLLQDELREMLGKIGIYGSTLEPTLCKLFNEDEAGSADKYGIHETRVRLSILGGLALTDQTDFKSVFGAQALAGLYDRFIFAPEPDHWDWNQWWTPVDLSINPTAVSVPREQYERVRTWATAKIASGKNARRPQEIALRVAAISSAANGDHVVTEAATTAAIVFAEWQLRVRDVYSPGVAINLDGEICSAILDGLAHLNEKNPREEFVVWRSFANNKNFHRKYGSSMVTRNRDSLVNEGLLIAEKTWKGKKALRFKLAALADHREADKATRTQY